MNLQHLGLVGNCQFAALINNHGSVVWCCLPRFDAEPVFGSLLDPQGGEFQISPADQIQGEQRYLPNTNILETRFDTRDGSFRILDFAPRFVLFDRYFRPKKLVRIVEPLSGTPSVRVLCNPVLGWSKKRPAVDSGSHHFSFRGFDSEFRLTTDASLSYLNGQPFALTEKKHFVLSYGAPVEEPIRPLCERFFNETRDYWVRWVKHCDIPPMYQDHVIRSALALKLHCFEDTGAIIASTTTSIPESPGSGRTWDYRYCWLRDSYYSLGAFRLLGQFEEREQFLNYLINIASNSVDLDLAPLYRIDGTSNLDEVILSHWAGYAGDGPVRVGNQAAQHKQHDVFGEMVLALTPLFLDARFRDQASPSVLDLVSRLARKAISVAGKPDAGIWEYRTAWRPQTFSSMMCWAAADRMARIAKLFSPTTEAEFANAARALKGEILQHAVDSSRGCLVADYFGKEVDAALLQAIPLRMLERDSPVAIATIDAIRQDLSVGGWLRRYRTHDDFGVPEVAFTLCSFWLVEALAATGRLQDARALLENVLSIRSPLGLYSEDVNPSTGQMWGNFPQAYSHVGLIHAAFAASPSWAEVY